MNFGSFKYLTKEGLRSIWSHRLMSLASVLVLMSCLVLMGLAIMFSVNVAKALKVAEEMNVIVVHIQDHTSQEDIDILEKNILSIDNVKECIFISKEQAFEEMSKETGFPELFAGLDNVELNGIYPDKFNVVVEDNTFYNDTINKLKVFPNVLDIRGSFETAEKLAKIRQLVNVFGIALITVMFLVAVFIISNTIKLTMYSRRLEISIMKAVGATDGFIRMPFLVEGFVIGLFASVISYFEVYLFYKLATDVIQDVISATAAPFSAMALPIALGFLVVGSLTGVLGSLVSMGRYLKKEGSEISAI